MANKEAGATAPVQATVDEWRRRKKTPAAIHAGAMVHAGWRAGKTVSEPEYSAAVAAFQRAAGGGPRVK